MLESVTRVTEKDVDLTPVFGELDDDRAERLRNGLRYFATRMFELQDALTPSNPLTRVMARFASCGIPYVETTTHGQNKITVEFGSRQIDLYIDLLIPDYYARTPPPGLPEPVAPGWMVQVTVMRRPDGDSRRENTACKREIAVTPEEAVSALHAALDELIDEASRRELTAAGWETWPDASER